MWRLQNYKIGRNQDKFLPLAGRLFELVWGGGGHLLVLLPRPVLPGLRQHCCAMVLLAQMEKKLEVAPDPFRFDAMNSLVACIAWPG